MRQTLVIASNTWKDAEQYRLFWPFLGFAGMLLLVAITIKDLTLVDDIRVFEDMGFFGIAFCGNLLAVFLAADLLLSETERGTLDLHVAFGVSRTAILAGRYLGVVSVIAYAFGLMGATFLTMDSVLAGRFEPALGAAAILLAGEGIVLASLSMAFATFLPRAPAMILAFGFFLVGHFGHEVLVLTTSGNLVLATLGNAAYFLLPHLELFNLYGAWIMGDPRTPTETMLIGLYSLVYAGGVFSVAVLTFGSKRK